MNGGEESGFENSEFSDPSPSSKGSRLSVQYSSVGTWNLPYTGLIKLPDRLVDVGGQECLHWMKNIEGLQ